MFCMSVEGPRANSSIKPEGTILLVCSWSILVSLTLIVGLCVWSFMFVDPYICFLQLLIQHPFVKKYLNWQVVWVRIDVYLSVLWWTGNMSVVYLTVTQWQLLQQTLGILNRILAGIRNCIMWMDVSLFGPVMDWWPFQGVTCLSSDDACSCACYWG